MQESVALRVQIIRLAVSYPGVGRFRRAETGILGMEQTGARVGPLFLFAMILPHTRPSETEKGARRGERLLSYLPISARC
jgi:hypothetical protein